ncbi:ankyrin repeat domain-containing protein 29-like isoform X1 [Centruroides sculpturatus]|uniref:ankyrin repeat domain-containing protein 29-like isoform X1 n=1 Tax=Centruroides sculpturatus TaxID=218467 RepID=UPI000C6E235C|nr:ankyrin repeat domain-containing protein 29-like isoform X1 [Centruroides sculpturatus]
MKVGEASNFRYERNDILTFVEMPFQGFAASNFTYFSFQKETPTAHQLHLAALKGDLTSLVTVLDSGKVYIDCTDVEGTTALILACANNHYECAKVLLEEGSNVAACRKTGTTALFFAAQGGYLDIVQLLLKYKAPVDTPSMDGGTPLLVACQCNQLDIVQELYNHGANINIQMSDKATPLFVAAQNGHLKIVSFLLGLSADVNARRTDGATPLWIACQMGHTAVVRELLEKDAEVDATRLDGATPLFKAAHKGYSEIVELLIKRGASLGLLKNGESALHTAALFDHLPIVKILIAAGADPELKNQDGLTPLELAQEAGNVVVTEFLQKIISSRKIPDHIRAS